MRAGDLARVKGVGFLIRPKEEDEDDDLDHSAHHALPIRDGTVMVIRKDLRDGYIVVLHPVHGIGCLYSTLLEVVQGAEEAA